MGSKDDHLSLPTQQRMSGLATSKASAERLTSSGSLRSLHGKEHRVSMDLAQATIESWPEAPKKVGTTLLEHYGPPNEATPTKMFWYETDPWSRMELTADEVVHNFPTPHTDFLSQYVKYPVDADRASDLVRFDGSTLIDRTTGELGARCDHEAYNTLTLNLAVEIINGTRTVDEARDLYAETAAAFVMGRDAPYAEQLLFTPATDETADPDEAMITSSMVEQALEKVKDVFGQGETPR